MFAVDHREPSRLYDADHVSRFMGMDFTRNLPQPEVRSVPRPRTVAWMLWQDSGLGATVTVTDILVHTLLRWDAPHGGAGQPEN